MYVCVYLCKHLHVVCMYYVRTVIVGQVGRECPPTVAALTDGKVSVACQHTTIGVHSSPQAMPLISVEQHVYVAFLVFEECRVWKPSHPLWSRTYTYNDGIADNTMSC